MAVSKVVDVQGGILVAHDGSEHAQGALRTAVRYATALRTPVTVVRAWNVTSAPRPDSWSPGYMPPMEDFAAGVLAELSRDVEAVRVDNPEVEITAQVVQRSPAEAVVEASSRVDLVVVGSRGRGGFAGLLLGSVSEQVVRHSRCPVLVDKLVDATTERHDDREQLEQALASELKLD